MRWAERFHYVFGGTRDLGAIHRTEIHEGTERRQTKDPPTMPPPPPPKGQGGRAAAPAAPAAGKPVVDWGCSCGRTCLLVAGYVVAVEGDPIRDLEVFPLLSDLSKKYNCKCWDGTAVKAVCAAANAGRTP